MTHSTKSKNPMATEELTERPSKRLKASIPAEGLADPGSLASAPEEAEQLLGQFLELSDTPNIIGPIYLSTDDESSADEATIPLRNRRPPSRVPTALEGHEVNFLKPCPADIQNDRMWVENGEKWTMQDVSVEVRDHIQSYITNTLEPLEKYEGKAKRKWKNDCQTNCVRSRVKNLKRCWNGKKVVKGHACDNCIKAGTTCMMITKHAMVPTILPRAPELREGLTEQDLFFWVKPRVPEIVVLDE